MTMTKDDELIRRGDAETLIYNLLDGEPAKDKWSDVGKRITDIPAVPREMTAREYLAAEARMCKYYGLPSAFDVSGLTVDEAIEMVEKFAREHPERSEE